MSSQSELQARLSEAKAARHRLLLGDHEAVVKTGDGREVTFTRPRLSELERYIRELEAELGTAPRRRHALRFGV